MKSSNIAKKLEGEGYSLDFGRFSYWDGVPYIFNEERKHAFFIAETSSQNNSVGLILDFKFEDVLSAVRKWEKGEDVFDMGDYYYFMENIGTKSIPWKY